jgi:TPR repeat protein
MFAVLLASSALSHAEEPRKKDTAAGADLFDQAWKHDQGLDTTINMSEAIRLYRQTADAGNPLAKARLAMIYNYGDGVPVNREEAEKFADGIFPDVLKAAESNNGIAQLALSYMYFEGLGVSRNQVKGLSWLSNAVDHQLPLAWVNYGVAYERGLGTARNLDQAVAWYTKAASEGNNAKAQAYLGNMYRNGIGVPRDYAAAVYWYQRGAAQGNARAQTSLGYMFSHGYGVPRNRYEAYPLYFAAAQQNYSVAEHNLGVFYRRDGNIPAAVYWYRKAAAQGYNLSVKELGQLGFSR